jgi:hypothetical protein
MQVRSNRKMLMNFIYHKDLNVYQLYDKWHDVELIEPPVNELFIGVRKDMPSWPALFKNVPNEKGETECYEVRETRLEKQKISHWMPILTEDYSYLFNNTDPLSFMQNNKRHGIFFNSTPCVIIRDDKGKLMEGVPANHTSKEENKIVLVDGDGFCTVDYSELESHYTWMLFPVLPIHRNQKYDEIQIKY